MQLLFEATILDQSVDLNTYLKVLSQVYFDYEVEFDRKDFITYLYMLFANDHTLEDFQFGTDLLQQYIENNFTEFSTNPDSETTFKPKSRKRGSPGSNKESSMMNHD